MSPLSLICLAHHLLLLNSKGWVSSLCTVISNQESCKTSLPCKALCWQKGFGNWFHWPTWNAAKNRKWKNLQFKQTMCTKYVKSGKTTIRFLVASVQWECRVKLTNNLTSLLYSIVNIKRSDSFVTLKLAFTVDESIQADISEATCALNVSETGGGGCG